MAAETRNTADLTLFGSEKPDFVEVVLKDEFVKAASKNTAILELAPLHEAVSKHGAFFMNGRELARALGDYAVSEYGHRGAFYRAAMRFYSWSLFNSREFGISVAPEKKEELLNDLATNPLYKDYIKQANFTP